MPAQPSYVNIPALKIYIERIGAEELHFRKFIVKTYYGTHYYREKCIIRIQADGSITVSNQEFAPTEEEASAIKLSIAEASFPTCVKATDALYRQLKMQHSNAESIFYAFYDRGTPAAQGNIIMVQERAVINGRKAYIPWTYWSDGLWRRMEPDGKLPLWKPEQPTNRSMYVMVHEGAKVAEFVHDLCTNPDKAEALEAHPWKDELTMYEHWGMIGGALAPERTDYSDLKSQKLNELVYVCDNDWPGKEALRTVSEHYKGALKGIMFTDDFPRGWDLADPIPSKLFSETGFFMGQKLKAYTVPATWATEAVPVPNSKRVVMRTRSEFQEEWFHCVEPELYVHKDWPAFMHGPQQFNNIVRPYSDVKETHELAKLSDASKINAIKYSPRDASGIYNADGQRYVNTHVASSIEAIAGDAGPWLDFMTYLIESNHDRKEALRWCATLIARPDVKMLYGMLLISEIQGVGKSTLGEKILAPLIGMRNVSFPSEREIVEGGFNEWASHKRLAIVQEIYAGHSSKAYDMLKSIITDRTIQINKKYQSTYTIENWLHFFACSNSTRALKLSFDDRRWFVPKITTVKRDPLYWDAFNNWLVRKGGLGIIKHWAKQYVEEVGPVGVGVDAPSSLSKTEMIVDAYSEGQALVHDFLVKAKQDVSNTPGTFILDLDLVQLIKDRIYEGRQSERLEKPATVRKVAKAQGWHVGEKKMAIGEWGIRKGRAKIITLDESLLSAEGNALREQGRWPYDVRGKAREWFDI